MGCAFGAVYASLVLYQRIDGELFPGNELVLPSVPVFVPGTHVGVDVSLPGVASAVAKPSAPASRLNILVLGLDRRPGEPEDTPSRSDTMFIASIDKAEGRLQMLAIPRDLWSEIPYGNKPGNWAQAKINAAYSYGQFYNYPGGGAAAAIAAVQHDFNITIDHYVVIDWVGFVQRSSSHCRTRRPGRPSLAACQTNETYSAREIGPPTVIGRFASIGARLPVGTTPYR